MDWHGFVFQSNVRSSEESMQRLCDTIIAKGITSEYPEFVVRINEHTSAFVYLGEDFNAPRFMIYAMIGNQTGYFKVDSLVSVLGEVNSFA